MATGILSPPDWAEGHEMEVPPLVCSREALRGPAPVSLANKSCFWLSAARDPKPPTPVPLPKARTLPPRRKPPSGKAGPWASSLAQRQCPAALAVLAVTRVTADSTQHENFRRRDRCLGNDTSSDPSSPHLGDGLRVSEPGGTPNTSTQHGPDPRSLLKGRQHGPEAGERRWSPGQEAGPLLAATEAT